MSLYQETRNEILAKYPLLPTWKHKIKAIFAQESLYAVSAKDEKNTSVYIPTVQVTIDGKVYTKRFGQLN